MRIKNYHIFFKRHKLHGRVLVCEIEKLVIAKPIVTKYFKNVCICMYECIWI